MELIGRITDKNIGARKVEMEEPTIRYASRGIIVNSLGEIAIVHKKNKKEYKLPGGGIEFQENKVEAFKREILEETGCLVKDIQEMGYTEEIKSLENFKQISYVFVAKVKEDTGTLNLTEMEKEEGTEVIWMDIMSAEKYIEQCYNNIVASKYDNIYRTKFVILRDLAIIKKYKQWKEG